MIKITQSWRRFEAFNLNKRPLYSTRTTLWMFIRNCCRCCWQSVRSVIARAHGNDSRGNLTSLAQQTADARGLQPSLSLSLSLSLSVCLSLSPFPNVPHVVRWRTRQFQNKLIKSTTCMNYTHSPTLAKRKLQQ